MYRIDIMTLFPDTVGDVLSESILGRAQERDFLRIDTHQIRDYTLNKQKQVDDYPYGGGRGAVMQADPLYQCWKHITDTYGGGRTIYLSPCGQTFNQAHARRLASDYDHLILVCGHYEGIDQRFIDACVDEEISLGDFVLTGGEIAAMAVADAVCRMVPGVLPDRECFENESHWDGLLEYPQYSRPALWHGMKVPEVLTAGDHSKIERWRRKQSLIRTRDRRPDMYAKLDLSSKADQKLLREIQAEERLRPLPSPVTLVPAKEASLDSIFWTHTLPSHWSKETGFILLHGDQPAACLLLTHLAEGDDLGITDGKWSSSAPSALLEICATDPGLADTNLLQRLLDAAADLAREDGTAWLRMAIPKGDGALLEVLREKGFRYRGNLPGAKGRQVAYELRLN